MLSTHGIMVEHGVRGTRVGTAVGTDRGTTGGMTRGIRHRGRGDGAHHGHGHGVGVPDGDGVPDGVHGIHTPVTARHGAGAATGVRHHRELRGLTRKVALHRQFPAGVPATAYTVATAARIMAAETQLYRVHAHSHRDVARHRSIQDREHRQPAITAITRLVVRG